MIDGRTAPLQLLQVMLYGKPERAVSITFT